MQSGSEQPDGGDLLRELQASRQDPARVIAVLWTWLEGRMGELTARREKPHAIYEAALKGSYEGITDHVLAWLVDDPLRNAAELLARIANTIGDATAPLIQLTRGINGEEVLVAWRVSELTRRMGGDDFPPSVDEHPSLTTLARSLIVCPRFVNWVELIHRQPRGRGWTAAQLALDDALNDKVESSLAIHLDTLGVHGMTGWHGSDEFPDGFFDPDRIEEDDQKNCIGAVQAAVKKAAGPSSVLILPELAATPDVLEALREALRDEPQAPALTVVGLYHLPADSDTETYDLVAEEDLGNYLNEAVVLGPDGSELWRHRKLSCAEGKVVEDEPKVAENIRPGRKLDFVPTPLGNVAVAICLDTIAKPGRDRLVESPANVLFVPSLSPSVRRHRDSVRHLVEVIWGVAFVCNRSPKPEAGDAAWNEFKTRSFWAGQRIAIQIPDSHKDSAHPSFVFRLEKKRSKATLDGYEEPEER